VSSREAQIRGHFRKCVLTPGELRYVDLHTDIQVGDMVVASGLGEVYPKGLLIGTVAAVHQKPQGLFHEVEVQPAVDLAQLEEVLVLVP
jgi:rod shape-determining protein MreC